MECVEVKAPLSETCSKWSEEKPSIMAERSKQISSEVLNPPDKIYSYIEPPTNDQLSNGKVKSTTNLTETTEFTASPHALDGHIAGQHEFSPIVNSTSISNTMDDVKERSNIQEIVIEHTEPEVKDNNISNSITATYSIDDDHNPIIPASYHETQDLQSVHDEQESYPPLKVASYPP